MLRWIIGSSLKARLLVMALAAGILFLGAVRLRDMPVDVLPEFSQPYVEIQTEALGLSAAEVEALITVPLEADMLNGAAWLKEIRSESIPGLSSIILIFEPGTDLMRARQMVQERLTEVHTLPNVAKSPVMLNPVSSAGRVMMVGLSSEKLSLIEMSVLARWTIAPRLTGVKGVANVSIWGERRRQLQVQVDPERLRDEEVTLQQIIKTAGNALWYSPLTFLNASTPGTAGFVDTPNQRLGIRHLSPITTPDELAQMTVEGADKRLGDVAEVVENHQPLIGDAIINDEPGLVLVVEKFPWANTLEVTRGVEAALDALRPGLAGLEMDSSLFRPATFLEMAIDNLSTALLIGGALAAVVLFAFLFYGRVVLIASLAILASVATAVVVLYLGDAPINAMVLAGLAMAVAVVIDDAVVDVHNISRRLQHRRSNNSGKSTARTILEASLEMRGPMLYATAIMLLAVTPVFFLDETRAAFLEPAALSYALAIGASMLVALTVAPALSLILLASAPLERRESRFWGRLQRRYEAVLSRVTHAPRRAFFGVCAVGVLGFALLPLLERGSLLPTFKERDLLIEVEASPGTSHPEMTRIASQATRELRSIPGVRNVSAQIGRAVMSDQVGDVNTGELWVSIDPAADYDATVERIRDAVRGYGGLDMDVRTYLKACITESRTGEEDEDVIVRIYGDDWQVLRNKANEVKRSLSEIDGIAYAEIELPLEEPQVEIEVDLAAAKEHGLKPGDVRRAAATLLSGIEVGYLFEEQKVFDVVVWGVPATRDSLTSIRELLIDAPGGNHVQLQDVAEVRIAPAPTVIKRETVSRHIDVGANVRGRNLASVTSDVEQRLREMEFPLEYRAELLGGSAERLAAKQRVLVAAILATVGAFLILQAAVGGWRLASMMFLTLPAALAGGVLTALLTGAGFTLGAALGFGAVLGIAVRNAITLVKFYQHLIAVPEDLKTEPEVAALTSRLLEPDGPEWTGPVNSDAAAPELIQRGTAERFIPIMTTAVASAAAILPIVVAGGAPGSEVLHPMATVILGGLVTSTLFTLFGVPAMFLLFKPSHVAELDDLGVSFVNEDALRDALSRTRGAGHGIQLSK